MSHQEQGTVDASSPTEQQVQLLFPLGVKLHSGKQEEFQVLVKEGRLVNRLDFHPVLRSLLERLQEEVYDLEEVTGTFLLLVINVKFSSAVDSIVRHAVLACCEHDMGFRYESGRRLTTVSPTFAV